MNEENKHIVNFELLTRFLADEVDTNQRKEVEKWIDISPDNRKEFDHLEKIWNSVDQLKSVPSIDIDNEWQRQLQEITKVDVAVTKEKPRTIQLRAVLRLAASIVLLVAVILGGRNFLLDVNRTKLTETKTIELPDGSIVSLNGNSKLAYTQSFGKETRNIKLKGEAYFEVKTNPDKPFVISTGDASIKVLGTSFNVKAYKNQENIEVTVAEGRVSLYESKRQAKKVILEPGESGNYNKDVKAISKSKTVNPNYLAWKTKVLSFENTSLDEVLQELENVYKLEFKLQNQMLKYCTITVQFNNQDINSILKILESTLDINSSIKGRTVTFNGTSCQ